MILFFPGKRVRICSLTFLGLMLYASAALGAHDCESLVKLALARATVKRAEFVKAGSFAPPVGKAIPELPAFCRVVGVITPSSDSMTQFELWMPASRWNGKFQGVGNGGFAGSIEYEPMAAAVARGYATASTDTGHQADGADAGWALGHPEKIVDYGHRAIHEMTENAKTILRAFYGESPARSYFSSCSNGHFGRSAGFFVSGSSRLMTRWSEPRPMEMPWAVSTVKPIMAS
jgi:Tannase and feruloyl esterase